MSTNYDQLSEAELAVRLCTEKLRKSNKVECLTHPNKQGKSKGFDSCDWPSNLTQIGFKLVIFQPRWPWNLNWKTLKHNRTLLLYYIKACASFQSHWWIQTGVTGWKRSIWVKINDFLLSYVTLKFDGWPWKKIRHLFYTASTCASFQSYGWLQTGGTVRKCSIWVKIGDFLSRVTLKFDRWPWKP